MSTANFTNQTAKTSKVLYTKMPNAAVVERIPELGKAAVLVYLILAYHADKNGDCFPSLSLIGKESGFKRSTVCKALKVLECEGLIDVERGTGGKGNKYKLTTLFGSTQTDTTPQPDSAQRDTQPSAQRDTQVGPKGIQELNPLTKPNEPKKSRALRFDENDREIASWMLERIRTLDPNCKEPNLDSWANDIRLMRQKNNRTPDSIRSVFGWANASSFWKSNILSPAKLRDKFTTLLTQMNGENNGNGNHKTNGHRPGRVEGDADVLAQLDALGT